ncbi:MAG: hypothetical protein II644_03025 [Paludibacteraceae bacterium]|nr:hypothetical protein [Paludibacteraceae bacterium]
MKKSIIICLLACISLGFTGCIMNSSSSDVDCKFHKKTIDLVCNQNEWLYNSNSNSYYCHFTVDQLTRDVYNYGEVSVSREYNSGSSNAYQVALPETTYMVENDGTNTFYYAQHVDYLYGVGYIEVYYTVSDYFYPANFTPGAMVFRAQLTY